MLEAVTLDCECGNLCHALLSSFKIYPCQSRTMASLSTTPKKRKIDGTFLQMSSLRNVLDTPFTSIPVSWRTLLQHVHVVDSDVNLERLLSETENADAFSQISID